MPTISQEAYPRLSLIWPNWRSCMSLQSFRVMCHWDSITVNHAFFSALFSRISHNNFVGRIPEFLGRWKNLQFLYVLRGLFSFFFHKLQTPQFKSKFMMNFLIDREMEGSGLRGPIPSSISSLNLLSELWVEFYIGYVFCAHFKASQLNVYNIKPSAEVTCMFGYYVLFNIL